MTYKIEKIALEEFSNVPRGPGDKFAGTFVAKARTYGFTTGITAVRDCSSGVILGAAVVTTTKNKKCANLQLLHVFEAARRKGIGTQLVQAVYDQVKDQVEYFRVSSEPTAIEFYKSLGFKFHGMQKSGSYLSIHRVNGDSPKFGNYSVDDYIVSKLFSGKRGGVVRGMEII